MHRGVVWVVMHAVGRDSNTRLVFDSNLHSSFVTAEQIKPRNFIYNFDWRSASKDMDLTLLYGGWEHYSKSCLTTG